MDIRSLITSLQRKEEHVHIEAKPGNQIGVDEKKTICSFSNTTGMGGGYILFGITEQKSPNKYLVTGVKHPEQLQNDLATQCRTNFNISIRPEIETQIIDDKVIVAAYIPEADSGLKPVYIKSLGVSDGTFLRIGASDQLCTDEDLADLYNNRGDKSYDTGVLTHLSMNVLNPDAINEYRRMRSDIDSDAAELKMSDEDLLFSLNCAGYSGDTIHPTVAGLILFGKKDALVHEYPIKRCDYIRIVGTEWAAPSGEGHYTIELNEGLFTLIPKAMAAIMDDIPRAVSLPKSGLLRDENPTIPSGVIREALVNLLMHRDYRKNSTSQIIRYSDRIEFCNPGYSLKENPERAQPGTAPRNPIIAYVLHETKYAENRGYGIKMMMEEMKRATLPLPEFMSDKLQKKFTAIIYLHNLMTSDDLRWLDKFSQFEVSMNEKRVLVYARGAKKVKNADCRTVVSLDATGMSNLLKRLVRMKLLVQHEKGPATYYTLNPQYVDAEAE